MFLSRTLICSWERRWWLVSLLFGTTVEFGLVGIARRRLLGLMVKIILVIEVTGMCLSNYGQRLLIMYLSLIAGLPLP